MAMQAIKAGVLRDDRTGLASNPVCGIKKKPVQVTMRLATILLFAGGLLAAPLTTGAAVADDAHSQDATVAQAEDGTTSYSLANHDAGPHLITGGVSYGNITQDEDGAALFTLEWRPGIRYFHYANGPDPKTADFTLSVAPFIGGYVGTDQSLYGYAGFGFEFLVDQRFYAMPNTAIGAYERGDGRDLGSALEFRSGIELGYRGESGWQAGIAFHHLSNASIADENPGTEHLSLFVSIPTTLLGF